MSKPSRDMSGSSRRALMLPVYVPAALLSFAEGLLLPILPVYALSFDVSYGMAALVIAAAGIGTVAADLPAGLIIGRLGLKPTMLIGATLTAVGMFALAFASHFPELILYRLLAGVGQAMWSLSLHAFIAETIHPRQRGRVISVFGGTNRIGMFSGPLAGGLVGQQLGLSASFYLSGMLCVAALVVAIFHVADTRVEVQGSRTMRWGLVWDLVRVNRGNLTAASVALICGQMIRAGRQTIIPFYGASVLGLNVAQIGTVQSASSVVDIALFIPAGHIMDRYGRKFAAVPSFVLMGIGMAMIPFTGSYLTLIAVAVLIGIGNGLGAGVIMTLGADLAPRGATGEFLGLWRLIGDSGRAGGPMVAGGLTDSTGFTFASIAVGAIGVVAALTLALLVKETRAGPEP